MSQQEHYTCFSNQQQRPFSSSLKTPALMQRRHDQHQQSNHVTASAPLQSCISIFSEIGNACHSRVACDNRNVSYLMPALRHLRLFQHPRQPHPLKHLRQHHTQHLLLSVVDLRPCQRRRSVQATAHHQWHRCDLGQPTLINNSRDASQPAPVLTASAQQAYVLSLVTMILLRSDNCLWEEAQDDRMIAHDPDHRQPSIARPSKSATLQSCQPRCCRLTLVPIRDLQRHISGASHYVCFISATTIT